METTDARIRAIADQWTREHARGGWFARTDLEELIERALDYERLKLRLGEVETALSGAHQQIRKYEEEAVTRVGKGVCCSATGSTAASNEAKQ